MSRYSYGKASRRRLATCHHDLQHLCHELIKHRDITIISGKRGEAEQNALVADGKSKLVYPLSEHNSEPLSTAVDMAPYHKQKPHIRWNDREEFLEFSGFVKGVAATMGIDITWGGDWDNDGEFDDQQFNDLPHFELRQK